MYSPRLIIFTDGSINETTETAGSSAIVYDTKKMSRIEKIKATRPGTNNVGELVGIELAFKECIDYKDNTSILIISDSKYAMDILENFDKYYNWALRTHRADPYNDTWTKKGNEPYKNQEIIKTIHKKYMRIFNNIRFVHINSHLSSNKKKDVMKVIEKFAKQGLHIDEKTAIGLIEGNKLADRLAKEACS